VPDEIKRSPRAERRDAAENRRRILSAAQRLFDRHGVEQVSMNQIAAEAGIGPGTLYRRYRNKSELCLDLNKDNLVRLFEELETYLTQHRSRPADERLKGTLDRFIAFREKKAQLLKGVDDSAMATRPKEQSWNPMEELRRKFAGLFEEMAEDGPATAPRSASLFQADMLLNALTSDAYLFQRNVRGLSPEAILEQLCLLFIPKR